MYKVFTQKSPRKLLLMPYIFLEQQGALTKLLDQNLM